MQRTEYILMGVGSELRGDDGIGPYIARRFRDKGWLSLDCGTAPENFTSVIKRHRPRYLIIVDAAEMGLGCGEYRRIAAPEADTMYISTHSIPLSALLSYLEDYCENIILIGIQPKELDIGQGLSDEVRAKADQLMEDLKNRDFERIKAF